MSGSSASTRAVCIWLHGLGDSGRGWSFFKDLFQDSFPNLSWRFPDSPYQAVTLAGGQAMPSWMDLDALPVTEKTPEDTEGYHSSSRRIHELVDKEVAAGYTPQQIFLGGFSQGGSMALYSGLKYKETLGGIISFSGWLPQKLWDAELKNSPTLASSRVLLVHGTFDSKVLFDRSVAAKAALTSGGVKAVELHDFPGDHTFAEVSQSWLTQFFKEGGV